jgi:pantoate--beta-alanine ligase
MNIIHNPDEMRAWSRAQRCAGKTIGFVPTMGALHEGHTSLLQASINREDVSVVSIFVNPTQFAPHEDFEKYPRTLEADGRIVEDMGADAIYAPNAATMYPEGYTTYLSVEALDKGLCSATRPHFFRGVATVVIKLFNAVQPDRAYFGQKDAQQCAVLTRMARDLDTGIEIVEMPIIRDPDGLAMSSRNQYLNNGERERALCLSRSLFAAREQLETGERDAGKLVRAVRQGMAAVDIDYVELVDAGTLEPVSEINGDILLAVAAQLGETRLIDNIKYSPSA